MKIGILTFHRAHNYGAVIQCYGLQQYLTSLGHDVSVVDYQPRYFGFYKLPSIRLSLLKKPIRFLKNIIHYSIAKKRYNAFNHFIENHLNLVPYNSSDDFSGYDAIILGSDQIWNPRITGGSFDNIYFGTNAKCKVISYAASSKFIELTESQKEYFRKHLDDIDFISVREISLRNLLTPLSNKPIELVIDPSLLPGSSTYLQLINPIKQKKKYVLVYEITRNIDTLRIANEVAKQLDAEVIELVSNTSFRFLKDKTIKQHKGPNDFLSYIKYAHCIITSSFHGMALSLKLQKDFYAIRQGTNSDLRAESLLSKLELLDRFILLNQSVNFEPINYSVVLPKLDREITHSQTYLVNALKNE